MFMYRIHFIFMNIKFTVHNEKSTCEAGMHTIVILVNLFIRTTCARSCYRFQIIENYFLTVLVIIYLFNAKAAASMQPLEIANSQFLDAWIALETAMMQALKTHSCDNYWYHMLMQPIKIENSQFFDVLLTREAAMMQAVETFIIHAVATGNIWPCN